MRGNKHSVVPAKAGTHNPWILDSNATLQRSLQITNARGYGSPPSRGRLVVGDVTYAAALCRSSSALYSANSSPSARAMLGRARVRS
jgi:hypothetical protein